MEQVRLGATEVRVGPVVLGTMARHGEGRAARLEVIHAALEAGITTLDTAPLYAYGDAERWVGEAIAGRRDSVTVCTKVGLRWDGDHGDVLFVGQDAAGKPRPVRMDSRPEAVRADVEESLERLGVEHLDLVMVHFYDRSTPLDETMGALADLVRARRVRAVGVSNFTVSQLRDAQRALGSVPLASVQLPYSLADRSAEEALLPWARAEGVAVLAYSPLAEGRLAKPRPSDAISIAVRTTLAPIAERHDASLAEVALAWLLARPGLTAVVAGASQPAQVERNAAAMRLALSADERERLDRAFPRSSGKPLELVRRLSRLARDPRGTAGRMWQRLRRR